MLWTEPGEGPGPGLGPKMGPGERPAPGEGPGWDIPTEGSVGVDICQVWGYGQDKKNRDTKRYVHVIYVTYMIYTQFATTRVCGDVGLKVMPNQVVLNDIPFGKLASPS